MIQDMFIKDKKEQNLYIKIFCPKSVEQMHPNTVNYNDINAVREYRDLKKTKTH